jgi:hypothetical protein
MFHTKNQICKIIIYVIVVFLFIKNYDLPLKIYYFFEGSYAKYYSSEDKFNSYKWKEVKDETVRLNDFSSIISKKNIVVLWDELLKNNYIDKKGKITEKFKKLNNASEMIVSNSVVNELKDKENLYYFLERFKYNHRYKMISSLFKLFEKKRYSKKEIIELLGVPNEIKDGEYSYRIYKNYNSSVPWGYDFYYLNIYFDTNDYVLEIKEDY